MGERKAEPLSAEEITELRGWDNHTTITRLLATLDAANADRARLVELVWEAHRAVAFFDATRNDQDKDAKSRALNALDEASRLLAGNPATTEGS